MKKAKNVLFLNQIPSRFIENKSFDLNISCLPLIKSNPIDFNVSDLNPDIPWVFTSKNAVDSIGNVTFSKKIFSIGKSTASQLKNCLIPSESNARSLAKLILNEKENEVLFICGSRRRDELPNLLKKEGVNVKELIVYETKFLNKNVNLHGIDALVFMSPSSVMAYAENNEFKDLSIFAIGTTTAQTLKDLNQEVIISCQANINSLINTIKKHFE